MNLSEAFDLAFPDAIEAESWYVTLMERFQRYGGPEEGGWWYENSRIVKYARFPTREQAEKAVIMVEAKSREMTAEALIAHGNHCLRQMEWLDGRGLDSDSLPELDGPDEFYVLMTQGLPEENLAKSHYC